MHNDKRARQTDRFIYNRKMIIKRDLRVGENIGLLKCLTVTGQRWESLCPLQSYLPGSPEHPWSPHPGSTTLHTGIETAEMSHNIHSYQWPCINLWELHCFGWKCWIVLTPANFYNTNIPHSYRVIYENIMYNNESIRMHINGRNS